MHTSSGLNRQCNRPRCRARKWDVIWDPFAENFTHKQTSSLYFLVFLENILFKNEFGRVVNEKPRKILTSASLFVSYPKLRYLASTHIHIWWRSIRRTKKQKSFGLSCLFVWNVVESRRENFFTIFRCSFFFINNLLLLDAQCTLALERANTSIIVLREGHKVFTIKI